MRRGKNCQKEQKTVHYLTPYKLSIFNKTCMAYKTNPWTIGLAILLTAIIVGGGVFLWENKTPDTTPSGLSENTNSEKTIAEKNTVIENSNSSLCTDEPMGTDIGRDIYPIDPKYKNTQFLGQIFTAYECGEERMSKIDGVKGNTYILGSSVRLKNNPSPSLIATFTSLGFKCDPQMPDSTCTRWETKKVLKIEDIMKLEPFYQNFENDDCVNCG